MGDLPSPQALVLALQFMRYCSLPTRVYDIFHHGHASFFTTVSRDYSHVPKCLLYTLGRR